MKIWWYNNPHPGNFGDILTPYILDYFGIKYEFSTKHYDAISTGSIATYAKNNTTVLGSGIISSNDVLNINANWKFVRGPLTRNKIISSGGYCPPIYGDPGLLLPLLCEESNKEYEIGVVPHYIDYDVVKQMYPNYKIINLLHDNPLNVAKEITKCRKIISSSLHGIICAHSYNIPAAWVKFSNKLVGDDIKFYDYYLSVGAIPELSTIADPIYTIGKYDIEPIISIFKSI